MEGRAVRFGAFGSARRSEEIRFSSLPGATACSTICGKSRPFIAPTCGLPSKVEGRHAGSGSFTPLSRCTRHVRSTRGDNRDGIRGVKFRPPQLPIF